MSEKKRVLSSSRYKKKEGPKVRHIDHGVWNGSSQKSKSSASTQKRKGCGCGSRQRKKTD